MIRYIIAGADVVDEHPDGKWVLEKDARAEIARLGRELNLAKYGEPDFSWSIHKEAMSELLARAVKAEAERDEARAQVAALEAYGREKVREGMQRAYDLSGQYHQITHIRAAILAEMEKLK